MLLECSCGEPLIDSVAKCPACGKPNPACRPSRWRIFWPDISSVPGADDAVQLGYGAASFVAVMGVIEGFFFITNEGVRFGVTFLVLARFVDNLSIFALVLAPFVDAGLFAICALGISRNWRSAAVVALLLFVSNLGVSFLLLGGIRPSTIVVSTFVFVGLLNGLRGTFARVGLIKRVARRGPE